MFTNKDWKEFFENISPDEVENLQTLFDVFFDELEEDPKNALLYILKISEVNDFSRVAFIAGAMFCLAATRNDSKYLKKLSKTAEMLKSTMGKTNKTTH